jgi:endonuclease-3
VDIKMSSRVSIAERAPGREVLEILKSVLRPDWREYVVLVADKLDGNPFAVLAAIILSQNTSDKNSIKAYMNFRKAIGVRPEEVLSKSLEEVREAIRAAGLADQKAKAIVEAARLVTEKGGEEWLVKAPPEELRRELLRIRGIGKKTVDVFLSFYRGYGGVFAVDTHAARIAKRWGLVRENASYEEISKALLDYFGPENSEEAHRLLIALGRRYCRAKRPLCDQCPLRELCPWPHIRSAPQQSRQQSRAGKRGLSRKRGT